RADTDQLRRADVTPARQRVQKNAAAPHITRASAPGEPGRQRSRVRRSQENHAPDEVTLRKRVQQMPHGEPTHRVRHDIDLVSTLLDCERTQLCADFLRMLDVAAVAIAKIDGTNAAFRPACSQQVTLHVAEMSGPVAPARDQENRLFQSIRLRGNCPDEITGDVLHLRHAAESHRARNLIFQNGEYTFDALLSRARESPEYWPADQRRACAQRQRL